jgi:hypothetical protein
MARTGAEAIRQNRDLKMLLGAASSGHDDYAQRIYAD